MSKPLHKMTNYELRDELQRKRDAEHLQQLLLIAAYNKAHNIELAIDNAFCKFFNHNKIKS